MEKFEFIQMRNVKILDNLNSVDSQENVKFGGKVLQLFEGVFYRENVKVSALKKLQESSLL